jgi:hypothetical protein
MGSLGKMKKGQNAPPTPYGSITVIISEISVISFFRSLNTADDFSLETDPIELTILGNT